MPDPNHLWNVPATLLSGQCFRWCRSPDGEWYHVAGDTVIGLVPVAGGVRWQTFPLADQWEKVTRAFRLEVNLDDLYHQWATSSTEIAAAVAAYRGMRVMRQETIEVFFAFLCASCNTIVKIQRSVRWLATRYGYPICTINGLTFHRFPDARALAEASEEELRAARWGFRAPRVIELAQMIADFPDDWFHQLSQIEYQEARQQLVALFGIGLKIADCICLFGLGHDEAAPIDTHTRRAAERLISGSMPRTLTINHYERLAETMRRLFCRPGWAQQYFFAEAVLSPAALINPNSAVSEQMILPEARRLAG